MSKRLTAEEFIERAKKVHGDKYDYSKVEYVNTNTKVCIICHEKNEFGKEHGEFWQTPHSHLSGIGCGKCAGKHNYTTEEFIEKARKIHGDKYDYSKVEYINAFTKICIICPEHGEFWQMPYTHLNGNACPKCGIKKASITKKYTLDEFIKKAKEIHNDRYDYSKTEYIKGHEKTCIICHKKDEDGNEHGEFWQKPKSHLKGCGCPKCTNRYTPTTEEWIEKAKKIHVDKYDYSKVEYKGGKIKICIICHEKDENGNEHGEFWQRPNDHLRGHGCSKCGNKKKREMIEHLTTDEFVERAIQVHGDKYDYSKVNYVNCITKVCVICPVHGEFWQTPIDHLSGHGCQKCCGNLKLTTKEWIKKVKKIHGDKFDYSKVDYKNNHTDVCIICPEHGEFWQTPYCHLGGSGCPICKESRLEREISLLFNDTINYERQKKFSWLKNVNPMSLDFYLPEYNIAIECQGIQHFEAVEQFGGDNELLNTIKRDELKYNQCKEHGIEVLYYTNVKVPEDYDKHVYTDKDMLLEKILSK